MKDDKDKKPEDYGKCDSCRHFQLLNFEYKNKRYCNHCLSTALIKINEDKLAKVESANPDEKSQLH